MNRLARATSPYLRQHKDNPVDWYPWGDEAFAKAKADDKPVLLSVGYSACHWCHVMAHESFEDEATAAVINDLFVNVKVDREERPDVDAIYMDATQAMTGHGGWPMTVFCDPEGRPFYCGTYFPKQSRGGMPSFLDICRAVDDAWRNRRSELLEHADELTTAIGRTAAFAAPGDTDLPGREVLTAAYRHLREQHDDEWGGFGGAPKFPQTMSLELLLRAHHRNHAPAAIDSVRTSLDAMASGDLRPSRRWVRPLLGRRHLAGAPLREDAVRPSAPRPRVPPRMASHGVARLPPSPRRNHRLRAARSPTRTRRLLLR